MFKHFLSFFYQRKISVFKNSLFSSEEIDVIFSPASQRSADIQLSSESHQSAVVLPLTIENPPLAPHLLATQSTNQQEKQGASSQEGGLSEEFGFESTESSGLIADLVELQLNEWGRKVTALKQNKSPNKMAAIDHVVVPGKTGSALRGVDFFTERKPYFRNLTPEDSDVGESPQFLNLTPDGYGTNVESHPEASFEDADAEDRKAADGGSLVEAYIETLGKTGYFTNK